MSYIINLTNIGATKIASALVNESNYEIAQVVFGDEDGELLSAGSTRLGNQVYAKSVDSFEEVTGGIKISISLIPNEGGFTIREIGLVDSDGDFVGYANFPDTYKTGPSDAVGSTLRLDATLIVDEPGNISFTFDTSNETVKYTPQTKTAEEKEQARENIGFDEGFEDLSSDIVKYSDQDRTEEERRQVRENIGFSEGFEDLASDVIKYSSQSRSNADKVRARENIGFDDAYEDLSSDVVKYSNQSNTYDEREQARNNIGIRELFRPYFHIPTENMGSPLVVRVLNEYVTMYWSGESYIPVYLPDIALTNTPFIYGGDLRSVSENMPALGVRNTVDLGRNLPFSGYNYARILVTVFIINGVRELFLEDKNGRVLFNAFGINDDDDHSSCCEIILPLESNGRSVIFTMQSNASGGRINLRHLGYTKVNEI